MKTPILLLVLACPLACPIASVAQTPDRMPVKDPKTLMVSALMAADGQAHGVLIGELADAIGQRFKATTPIFIDVTTDKRYRQAGCSRLKVSFWQDGVVLPSAKSPRKQTIDFGVNYCLDGLPPKSLQ